ncbi:Rhodanese-related sulfurtransferase [Gaiella occulta]|uniref:Rhodanese-related sulfurtransferase n=2 Tax=Gaiella occulta TaxID=1002870 RepID=A0A7M2YY74_9ACTN|nr:Rhodanese-related sulfurtransferase [Gaiella occulta]
MRRMRLRHVLPILAAASLLAGVAAGGAVASPPSTLVSPAAFARAVATPGTVTINVHVPDAGAIRGTDLRIPFDRIARLRGRLPAKTARLAVYCRSGRMSAVAVTALHRLGYERIVELRGGMDAWSQSGRTLLPPRS